MVINNWNPLREMEAFQHNIDSMFRTTGRQRRRGYPPVDLMDTGDQFVLRAIVPGISSDDMDISVAGGQVSIKGAKRIMPIPEARPIRRERIYGEFQRVVPLPEAVDTDRIRAEHADGILTLFLPKARAAAPVTVQF